MMSSVDHELRRAINTGRVHLGSKVAVREMRRGRARMAILSSNCPFETVEEIENLGKLSGTPVLYHQKDSVDMGILCGKPFPVSTIIISDPGDSKILELMEG
ncbi:MAG: 50S ribosomal protein L30e [Candidatus Bathyarchaeota archaeon]|jgi:large subunit ribosomal protein L30e